MRLSNIKIKLIFIFLFCILTANLYAQEEIVWLITKEPPITDMEDGEASGYGIDLLKFIHDDLIDYKHSIVTAGNYKRLAREVNEGPLACALGLFKTEERLKTMYFSDLPAFYFFNIQIVMRKSMFVELQQPQELSLDKLLQSKKYKLGISKGRTYSDAIRDVLAKYSGAENIYLNSQGNVAEGLLKMLLTKRIDYMFLYPEEAMYLSDKLDSKDKIVTVPILEAAMLSSSWAVCTKNKEGKKVIDSVSQSLAKIHSGDAYFALYRQWLSGNLHEKYKEEYDKKFN